jgi:anti-anti-sigma regulatory factor
MSTEPPRLALATGPELVCFRVQGKPTLELSGHLRRAAEQLIGSGRTHVLIDLTECPSVDSTFAGVLIYLSKLVQKTQPPGRVGLLQVGELVRRQLDSLGVLHRFDLAERRGGDLRFEEVALTPASKVQTAWLCLDAHRDLIEAHAANAEKFRDVVEFLEQDVRRLEALEPPPGPPPAPPPGP